MKHRPTPVSRRAVTKVGVLLSFGGSQLVACGDGEGTGGRRIELATTVEAEALDFVNAYGQRVELRRALISIGPLQYLTGAPVARRTLIERVFGIRVAHAHPGHYVAGGVLGEMLRPASVDLAAGPASLGVGPAVTGTALSGRFSFQSPPAGDFEAELGEDLVIVEGQATLEDASLSFRTRGRLEDVVDAHGAPVVEGCEFQNGVLDADGSVRLVVRPSLWLDQVDFSLVPLAEAGNTIELEPGQSPHKAFARGLKKAAAYLFEYMPARA